MKKRATNKMRALSVVLSLLMIFSVISFPTIKAKAAGTIDDFVERCYTVILNRPSEAEGFADWKNQLVTGQSVGAQVAYGFVFSKEYKNRNRSNKEYVTDLYKLFMDRDPDEGGFNDWVGKLEAGASREEVYVGFVNSQEFYNICDSYGITAGGFYLGYDRNQVNNVNLFVNRLYDTCLGRRGDRKGQQNWVNKLLKKEITGIECARSFIQSKEYINKNLSNEEYVENLYLAMMGRASDPEGKASWVNALASGTKTRDEVFAGFANSKEFGNICATYKIDKGSYAAKDVTEPIDPNQMVKSYRMIGRKFSCGDYSKITYEDPHDDYECIEKRYDKDGNFKGYMEYHEYNADYTLEKYGNSSFNDENGALEYSYFYKTETNKDQTSSKTYYYEDEFKTLISYSVSDLEKYTLSSDDGGTYDYYMPKKENTFDPEGNLIGYTEFERDSKGRILSQKYYGSDGKLRDSISFEYFNKKADDYYDRKKETYAYYDINGKEIYRSVYENDENGNSTKNTFYDNGVLSFYEDFIYTDGKLTKSTYKDKDGVLYNYALYEYDTKGNMTKNTRYEANGTKSMEYTYEFDSKNQLTRETRLDAYSGILDETLYEYDQNGNIVKVTKKVAGEVRSWEERQYAEYYTYK